MMKDPGYDRRKYPRITTETMVSVARVDSTDVLGWSLDVSQGGIRFQWVGLEVEVGEILRITLDLGGQHASALGKVVRTVALDAIGQEVSLAFVEAEAKTLELLQDHLEGGGESTGVRTFDLAGRDEEGGSMAQTKAAMAGAVRRSESLRSKLRSLSPAERAGDRARHAARGLARQIMRQLDRLPISTKRRIAAIDRRVAKLARKKRHTT